MKKVVILTLLTVFVAISVQAQVANTKKNTNKGVQKNNTQNTTQSNTQNTKSQNQTQVQSQNSSPQTTDTIQGESYEIRLKELRDRVNDLKSKVFEAKARLDLLKERVLHNLVSDAKIKIIHSNQVGVFLDLKSVAYYLDGNKIYGRSVTSGGLPRGKEFVVYSGTTSPTHHILNVVMTFEGSSGLFSYLEGYHFTVRGSLPFYASKGQEIIIKVVGYQKGGLTRLEESPSLKFVVRRVNLKPSMLKEEIKRGGK